jgi:hypothetical protein
MTLNHTYVSARPQETRQLFELARTENRGGRDIQDDFP